MIAERPSLERRVMASLDAGRIPVVLGGCGAGRTSLLLRIERLLGGERSQYLDFSAVMTTPERALAAVSAVSRVRPGRMSAEPDEAATPASPRAAFDLLMSFFDGAAASGAPAPVFLCDEVLDIRTFENFPGLRQVQRDFVARLSASPARFVLASRFTDRTHRLLRDAPARFEVVHLPPLTAAEVQAMAARFDGSRRDLAHHAATIAALTGSRAAYTHLLMDALASQGPSADPAAALAALFAPDGRLTARCRESYDHRLARARGFGALKAILGILADHEPQNLTEIAQRLHRTPGSTKDYLSWLEDVDLIGMHGKRYSYEDSLLRLYVRLHVKAVPPSDADVVREVRAYAQARAPQTAVPTAVPVAAAIERAAEPGVSGIIEID
ncbi:MAG TPA: hypothetical protein VFV78_00615 [Vicinamibacterales bacterium]|nr:hypothetical protein [Vicinamibacterales bacterium]